MSRIRYQSIVMLAVATFIVFVMTGCQAKTPPLTPQEQKNVSELTQTMQTRCIGRFMVDMPKDIVVFSGQYVGLNREVKITRDNFMSFAEFNARMAQIEQEYKAKRTRRGEDYFYSTSAPDPSIRLFETRESDDKSDSARIIEGYKWSNDYVIKMVTKARDYSDLKYRDEPIVKQMTNKVNTAEKKALLTNLLQRSRGRPPQEIPTEPGLCFEWGFLAGKAGEVEEFSATFEFRKMKDVSFRFTSDNDGKADETLLGRSNEIEKVIKQDNGKTMRKGSIKLAGIPQVEEWLISGDMLQGGGGKLYGHYFKIEGNSKLGSPQTPFFDFIMENGGAYDMDYDNKPTKASLTDAEALALWDAVSRTIKMRPGAL